MISVMYTRHGINRHGPRHSSSIKPEFENLVDLNSGVLQTSTLPYMTFCMQFIECKTKTFSPNMDPLLMPASFDDDNLNANIQPSTDDPNEKKTKLTDLPDKCLATVFKYVPLQNLDDIIEFSPKWNKLIQDHVPVEVHLTDIGFRIAMHYFVGHEDLPKYRIKVIHSRVLDESLPALKSPEDLLVLNFATHTELTTYKHLTDKAENLEELMFGYSSLTSHPLHEVDVNFPKLTLLYLADRIVESKKMDPDRKLILPKNVIGFLNKMLPSIKKVVVCTVASRKTTVGYAKALLGFIQRHSGTLKIIKFTVSTSIQNVEQTEPVADLVEFSSVEEGFNTAQMTNVKFTEVDVNFGRNFFCGLEQWRAILQNQSALAHLTIGAEKPLHPEIFQAPITLSASNLVSVQIGVLVHDGHSTNPLDCSIFENCVNLKMLILCGPPMTTGNKTRTASKELINLAKLPVGLYALALEHIYLETRQIAEFTRGVMQRQRPLDKLAFHNIGTSPGYGVTLPMLDCWLTSQVLQEIIVKGGLNADESRLPEYDHLTKFGVKSPISKCSFHAYFYTNFMEYRKPAEYLPQQ